jgi:hypothetical protein
MGKTERLTQESRSSDYGPLNYRIVPRVSLFIAVRRRIVYKGAFVVKKKGRRTQRTSRCACAYLSGFYPK